MSEIRNEQRRFTRVALDVAVEIHQGGSLWQQRAVNISLGGIATDQPDVWDAQYNEPFTLIVHLDDKQTLELHAYLQHVEAGLLAFAVQNLDAENVQRLRALLEQHLDIETLESELAVLNSQQ